MLRKLLSWLLILALFCSVLPIGVFAREARNGEVPSENTASSEGASLREQENDLPSPSGEDVSADTEVRTYEDYRLGDEIEDPDPKKEAYTSSVTEGACGASLQWSFQTDSGELIISGTGDMEDYSSGSAPWYSSRSKIKKLTIEEGVSSVGNSAFYACTQLTEVSLPKTLKRIGQCCFQQCTTLTAIPFPEGLETIGYAAFNLADLKAIHLPASLTTLGGFAFHGCINLNEINVDQGNEIFSVVDGILYNDVTKVLLLCPANRTEHLVIPDTVELLSDEGLAHCTKLEGITIPDEMRWEPNAFTYCNGLLNVYVSETNPIYQSMDGVLYSKNGKTLVLFPAGRSGSYTVADGTKEIGYGAFCRMENEIDIIMPDSVEVIGGSAFSYSTGLQNLKLSANLQELYAHGFEKCTNMNNVVLPETLTSLGYGSFEDCQSITEITVPSQIDDIATDVFRNCTALTKVELKGNVKGIYSNAFYGCTSLESINFPESLEKIAYMAFYRCGKLRALDLPIGMSYLGSYAFGSCKSITKAEVPQGVETLSSYVFDTCTSLKEITLPNGLKTIESGAFYNTGIEQIMIPETVTELGTGVFRFCRQLHSIHFLGDAPAVKDTSLDNITNDLVLYYTEGKEGWSTPEWNGIPTAVWSYDFSTTASCTLNGQEHFRCKHCTMEVTRSVGPLGHSFGPWTVGQEPTETVEGYWIRSCKVCGAEEQEVIPLLTPAEQKALISNNLDAQNYTAYGRTVKSYLVKNTNGTLTRIEAGQDSVHIEHYSSDFRLIECKKVPMELPIFGGFYEGDTDYFLAFGQVNENEEDSCEVVRVVRYSKDWLRKGHSSLYGANTYYPFDAGSLRMTQYGDMLYVHTCHEMYKSSDGYHHQANMIFGVYLPQMIISDQYTGVMNVSYGYVSHSFNQFILTDGNSLLTLNHGDAYPRSAVIVKYNKPAGEKLFTGLCQNTSVLKFYGTIGNNATGASLGAFELSSTSYLTAGNSILQDGTVSLSGQRNIFLGVTPRGDLETAESTVRWITHYDSNAGIKVSTPHLVKIDQNRFLLLWSEDQALRYTFVDGKGVTTSQIYQANLPLSDCKPIVYNGAVCWYVTQNSEPIFCSIPLNQPDAPTMSELKVTVTLDPNKGTLENNTLTVIYGKPYGQLPTPVRKSAYRFLGWFSSPYSSATQITGETPVSNASDHTLYARWEKQAHSCQMEITEVIPATCTTGETFIYTCIYCDYSYRVYDNNYVHTWDEGTVTTPPTCVNTGVMTFSCVLCGATKTEAVPSTGHTYTEAVTAPTCLERGYTTYTCACGYEYTGNYVNALGHSWDEGTITTAPGCETKGVRTYTCIRCPVTKTEAIAPTGHSYTESVTAPTCTEGGYTTYTCTCGHTYTGKYTAALGHSWDEGAITTAPGCTSDGVRTYTCIRCATTKTESVPPTGHSYSKSVTAPTCLERGYTTYSCSCGYTYTDNYVAPLGHNWDEGTITIAPGCETEGAQTFTCLRCTVTKTETVPPTGHSYTESVMAPTCLERGYTTYSCSCGYTYTDNYVAPLGHDWNEVLITVEPGCETEGERQVCCSRCQVSQTEQLPSLGHHWDEGIIIREPTTKEDGLRILTCQRCGVEMEQSIPSLEDKVCDGGESCPSNHFTDIAGPLDWSHEGIDFVVERGMFNGVTSTTFAPSKEMTRAMLVTVLWRYAGSPEEGSNIFSDVPDSSWYTNAVAWAAYHGVVNGVGDGRFEPDGKITREQMATILYRYVTMLGVQTDGRADLSLFPDSTSVSAYAVTPVEWAVAEGLISGIGKGDTVYLQPTGNATRAQVATILMRLIKNVLE